MEFKVGQMVKVVKNSGIVASLGATAIVTKTKRKYMNYNLIDVAWKTNSNNQEDGGYQLWHFEPAIGKNEQLLFSFMEK